VTVDCVDDVPTAGGLEWTDNCDGTGTASSSDVENGQTCPLIITRTWTYTDNCGNTATATQTITVHDQTAPVFATAPSDVTVDCVANIPAAETLAWTDNCDGSGTANSSDASNGQTCPQIVTRSWTYTDNCGNTATATQLITVWDQQAPAFTDAPADATYQCEADVPTIGTATWTDNCDGTGTVQGVETSTGSCPTVITRSWTYTDACGNSATATQTITVLDTTVPDATAPTPITMECNTAAPQGATDYAAFVTLGGTASDNCSAAADLAIAYTDGSLQGTACNGTIERTYSVTDACGNTTYVTQTINVTDSSFPQATAPDTVDAECTDEIPVGATDYAGLVALGGTASDNCTASADLTVAYSDGTVLGNGCNGLLERTYAVTDACGNTTYVTQTITITDSTVPEAVAPTNFFVQCFDDVPAGATTIADFLGLVGASASDNCSATSELTVTVSDNVVDASSCNGQIIRTYTIGDGCGNAVSVAQTISITDLTAPVITAPQTVDAECFDQAPVAVNTITKYLALTGASATDNCTDATELTVTSVDNVIDGSSCSGVIERTYTIADACGNTATAVQVITISDNVAPQWTTAAGDLDRTLECSDNAGIALAQNLAPAASDNCDQTLVAVKSAGSFVAGACPQSGTYTNTWTVTDDCNNTSTVYTQVITIVDSTPPTFTTCPSDLTVNPSEGVCEATINAGVGTAVYSDNCGTAKLQYTLGGATTGSGNGTIEGLILNQGVTEVGYVAFDQCGNQSLTCKFKVTVLPCRTINGRVLWEHDFSGLNNTKVTLSGDNVDADITVPAGTYSLVANSGSNFTVTPSKTFPGLSPGVTMADATRIQQHLFGTKLVGPYKRIAADVNKSNSITAADAGIVGQAVLGSAQALAFFQPAYRFIDSTFKFPVSPLATNWPFNNVPFPEQINLTGVTGNVYNQSFVGCEMGNVDGLGHVNNLVEADDRSLDAVSWTLRDQILEAGQPVEVEFRTSGFRDVAAYQFALQFDPEKLGFEQVVPLPALPLTVADNFGLYNVDNGELRAAWSVANGVTLPNGTTLFRLRFTARESGVKLSEVLSVDRDLLPAAAYTTALETRAIGLYFDAVEGQSDDADFQLLQNQPNPFADRTTLRFALPAAGEATLRIVDATGRELWKEQNNYTAGYHEVVADLAGLTAPGVLYCELTTAQGSRVRKMIAVGR
jgi:hypothetical protein